MLKGFCDGGVFAQVDGEGDLVVLLMHGWGRSSADYAEVRNLLSQSEAFSDLKIIAVDLPGFGSSPPPKSAFSTYDYGRYMTELLSEIKTSKVGGKGVVIVGHSFGGRVTLQMAAHDMVPGLGGIVLIGTPLIRKNAQSKVATSIKVARKLRSLGILSEEKMEELRKKYGSEDYRNARGVMREILVKSVNEDYRSLLPKVDIDTTLLFGELDQVTSITQASVALTMMPKATLVSLPGVGHMLPLQDPSSVSESILNHVRNVLEQSLDH